MVCVYRIKGDSKIYTKDALIAHLESLSSKGVTFEGAVSASRIDKETGKPILVYYTPSKRSITVTKNWVDLYNKDKGAATLALVHDVLHALVGTRSKEEQASLMSNLTSFKNELISTPKYKALLEKQDKTEEEKKIIGILSIEDVEELLTYGLTDADFAKFLDTIKTEKDGKSVTFWSEFKRIIRQIAGSFGIGTKLDELNSMFEQFITGGEINVSDVKTVSKEGDSIFDAEEDLELDFKPVLSFSSEVAPLSNYLESTNYSKKLDPIYANDETIPRTITFKSLDGKSFYSPHKKVYIDVSNIEIYIQSRHDYYEQVSAGGTHYFYEWLVDTNDRGEVFSAGVKFTAKDNNILVEYDPDTRLRAAVTSYELKEMSVKDHFEAIYDGLEELYKRVGNVEVNIPELKYKGTITNFLNPIKASSYSSTVNKELTGSPFEIDQEDNIMNVLSNIFIENVYSIYKGTKGKDVTQNQLRFELIENLKAQVRKRIVDNTISQEQKDLLAQVVINLRDNDKFWNHFRIHLSNHYGFNINDQDDFIEDIELLEKSWDNSDVVTKSPISTISDQIKNLINRTYEVDPNSFIIEDGKQVWKTNTNTPTGFANTLDYSERGNKIMDLMRGSLTKEDMLAALLNYANDVNSVFAKSLYSIHKELSNDPELLNAWFTAFDRAIVESYRDLHKTVYVDGVEHTEINLLNNNRNTPEYIIANEWTNLIISRGENGFFDKDWTDAYTKLYNDTTTLTGQGFDKLNAQIAANIVELYRMVGVELTMDVLFHEFNNNPSKFVPNVIAPLRNIAGIPGVKYDKNIPYIVALQTNPKSIFNEFGGLLRLADKVKYFREDHFTFSDINVTGNMIYTANKPSFVSNFFKKLEGSDETVFNALNDYLSVASNQHSLLLWGDGYVDGNVSSKGLGIFDYEIADGVRKPTRINKENLAKIRYFGYDGTKDLDDNIANEYSTLTRTDWTLRSLIYYFGGQNIKKGDTNTRLTAIFPMMNPSDRKNTRLFETPVLELSQKQFMDLYNRDTELNEKLKIVKTIPIFRAIYAAVYDELRAMETAKNVLFELKDGKAIDDGNLGFVLKKEFQEEAKSGQIYYHYKLKDGNKSYLKFTKDDKGLYRLDSSNSGNIFDLNIITNKVGNENITFNRVFINEINFVRQLMLSDSLTTALNTPLITGDETSTFKNRLEQFVLNFITQQIDSTRSNLSIYKNTLETSYIKKENLNREEKTTLLRGKDFITGITEYALNTFLFNVEQVKLFYGSVADYKSNIDLNKRGGQIVANGIPSVHTGTFTGATISDVKLKSKVYRYKVNAVAKSLGYTVSNKSIKKLETIWSSEELKNGVLNKEELEIYNIVSPYLTNDSANAVSFITFKEFEKRISGFGMTNQYSTIISKIKSGDTLNREETIRFASMQKNFYYSLTYNSDLQKMIPTQVKNAEVVLTPALIKDLQLESLEQMMTKLGLAQINLASAEKIGSLYIATIADENGDIIDDVLETELTKATRTYNYEGLRMQLEVPDAIYEEAITMSRQFAKKIIENIPDNGVEYSVNGKKINGVQLKDHYFELLNSNIYQDACKTVLPFDIKIDKDGNVIGDINYDTIVELLEREGIDRGLAKNILYSVQIGDTGWSRLPIFFNTHSNKWENILTSLFTNGVTNQKFPGLHAAQMSSLFMNKKKGVKWATLTNLEGINWHASMGTVSKIDGTVMPRKDLKLRSTVMSDSDEGKIIEAEVLLPRWAKEFYRDGEYVDINELSDEIRTMIGYRIPMEAKYSAYVFKVVGFLPDDNGPSIVLPDDFVTQTGSDFDMDSVYAFLYNLHTVLKTEIVDGKKEITKVIERLPFIKESSESALNSRVDAIMNDRRQLVHVLSTELDSDQLIEAIKTINDVTSEYFKTLDKTSPIYVKYATQFKKLDHIDKRLEKVKGKERKKLLLEKNEIQSQIFTDEAFVYYKDKVEYITIRNKVKTIISDWSVMEQNTKKARENEILDVYYSILTNPHHYLETIAISNFKDITTAKTVIDKKLGTLDQKVNNLTIDGQQHYRDKSHQGRDLKGVSLAADRFNSIAQVAKINITDRLRNNDNVLSSTITLPVVEYVINPEDKDHLIANYGNDVRFEKRDVNGTIKEYAIVTHSFIGNNPKNTFRNVLNQYINSYSAQTTANILDNVAFPLPNNINEYTTGIWKMLVSLGSTYGISTSLMNQPIIIDLARKFYEIVNSVERGSEIEQTKRRFQTLLYRVMVKNGAAERKGWEQNIEEGQPIFIGGSDKLRKEQYEYLGYENEVGIALNEDELLNNINYITMDNHGNMRELEDIIKSSEPDKVRLNQLEDHIRYQLQVLETFKNYKSYSDAVNDGINVLNTDSIGAGPTFDTTNKLEYNIQRINDKGILEIGGATAMSQIFPKFFDSTSKSVYPTLEQFYIFSNKLSVKLFAEHFISQSALYKYIKSDLNSYVTDLRYDDKLAAKITKYLNNSLLKDLPWVNDISVDEKRTILGIDTELELSIDLKKSEVNTAVSIFEQLSLANQIILLKTQFEYENNHILKSLKTATQEPEIKKNKFHKITFVNNDNSDKLTESFNNLWYSGNIFERIVARNLIKYEYTTNGFGFGYSSFSKIIPNNIFYFGTDPFMEGSYNERGIGATTHLYGKLKVVNGIKEITEFTDVDELSQIIFSSNYKERFIKSQWQDDNIVPDASGLQRWDSAAMTESGELGAWKRYFKPNKDGVIEISVKTYENIPTNKTSKKVRSRDVIKLSSTSKGETKFQLYKRITDFVKVDDNGKLTGTYYYFPINKLEYSENEEVSVFEENNVYVDGSELLSEDDYISIIRDMSEKQQVVDLVYKQSLPIESRLEDIRNGIKTATTLPANTADKFATVNAGDYIKIGNLNEYVKATTGIVNIDLSMPSARREWSEKNALSREEANKNEGKTDLFQIEFIYIGNLDNVIEDGKATMSDEGETTEEYNANDTRVDKIIKANPIGSIIEVEFDNATIKGKITNIEKLVGTTTINGIVTAINETISLDVENIKNSKKYQFVTYADGSVEQTLSAKGKTFVGGDTQIWYKAPIDDFIKPVSYTSSTNRGINDAINSAKEFIEKTTGSYANRIKILKGVGTLKDAVNSLTDDTIQQLLGENDLATLASALQVILKQYDFDLNNPKTETSKGGIVARLEEFENMDINTIISDKVVRKEFIGFMSRAISFLKGVTSFDSLSSINGDQFTNEEKIVNELIKQIQLLLPIIKNVETKVNRLYSSFEEANLYEYTSNPEIVSGIRKILDAGDDESYFQLKLDSLADTNNSFAALMVKQYMVNMINGEDDARKEIAELESLLRKSFPGKNITSLTDADFDKFLEKKNGRRTGKLLQKYDWDKFRADKKAHFEYLEKQYGRGSESFINGSKGWFKNNEIRNISDEELQKIDRKKKEDLSKSEYDAWRYRNIREKDGQTLYLIGDSDFAVPSDKYISSEWLAIKDDPIYQKFVEIIHKYTDYFGKSTILNRGFIPTLNNTEKENLTIAEKVKKWVDVNKAHKKSESIVGENSEMVYFLTVPMVDYLGQEEEIIISHKKKGELESDYELRVIQEVAAAGRGKFKSLGAIYAENKKIRKANDEQHAGKINYNLGEVFTQFIKEATTYKVKADMKYEYDLAMYQLRNMEFDKRDSRNKLLKDKNASKALKKTKTGKMSGEGTNLEQHFSEWLEAIFYGNFDIDEGHWTTISNMLLKYTSAKNMWFNVTAGINNVAIGKIQVRLEQFAGWYFKGDNLSKADRMYISAIPDIITNVGSTKAGNLTNAIIKYLDVAQNTNERDYSTGMLKKNLLGWSSMYFINDMGEHYMQNVSTLAMLDHHRIINGKIMSLAEFNFNNYKEALDKILNDKEREELERYLKTRYEIEEFKESKKDYLRDYILSLPIKKRDAFIQAKKELDKTGKQDFESNPKLIDAFYLDDNGYAQMRDDVEIDGKKYNTKLNDNEYAKFKNKAVHVVQKQQGIYNKEDAATMSRTAIGKMLIQFRKYMRPGWNKRFGSKFGKSYWTESRDEYNKGAYVSLYQFVTTPFRVVKDVDEAKQFQGMIGKILDNMYDFATNIGVYWNTLDDFEKANVRRALVEHVYLLATFVAAAMLKAIKPDDDDDENFGYDLLAYETDAVLSQVMMFTPFGLVNESRKILKTPAAVQSAAIDIYKAMSSVVAYPFQDEDARRYKTGVYKDDYKAKVNAIKLVPIINKVQQLQRINKFNKYYILFRG